MLLGSFVVKHDDEAGDYLDMSKIQFTGALHRTLKGHSDRVRAVAFSPNSQLLASASGDCTARLWDMKRKQTIQALDTRLSEASARYPRSEQDHKIIETSPMNFDSLSLDPSQEDSLQDFDESDLTSID